MDVLSVADARANLSRLIAGLRDDPESAPVAIGSHRKPQAVLVSVEEYRRVSDRSPAHVTLERLRQLSPLIERLAQASHLRDVQVYGSVARGDQVEGSDLDLLVTDDGATLFDIAQFEMDIELLVGVPVSAVPAASLDCNRDAHILTEAVPL